MPRIPRLDQGQRLPSGTRSALVDERQAGQRGRQIASVGQDVSQFGERFSNFLQAKERADLSLLKDQVENAAKERAEEARLKAIQEYQSPTGEDMQEIFDSHMEPLAERINEIGDPGKRQTAKNIFRAVQLQRRYKPALNDMRQQAYLDNMERNTENSLSTRGLRVTNNPESYEEELQQFNNRLEERPITGADKKRIQELGKKQLGIAAIEGMIQREDFEGAKEALNKGLGRNFSFDEQISFRQEIDKRMIQHEEREYQRSRRERLERQARLEEQSERMLRGLYSEYQDADSVADKNAVLQRGYEAVDANIMDPRDMNFLAKSDTQVPKPISDATRLRYEMKLYQGEDLDTIIDDIRTDVDEERMRPKEGVALINQLRENSKKSRSNSRGVSDLNAINNAIKTIMEPSFDEMGNLFYPRKQLQKGLALRKAIDDTIKANPNINIWDAIHKAAKIQGHGDTFAILPQLPLTQQGDPEAAEAYVRRFKDRVEQLKREGKLTPDIRETYLETLENFKEVKSYEKFNQLLQGPLTEQEKNNVEIPFRPEKEESFQVPYRPGREPEE